LNAAVKCSGEDKHGGLCTVHYMLIGHSLSAVMGGACTMWSHCSERLLMIYENKKRGMGGFLLL